MESVIRGLIVYGFLLLVFRLAGKRTLSETTNFELVLLLIISETTQQAMVDNDHSITNGFLLILTLVGCTVTLAWFKQRFPACDRVVDDVPTIIVENGQMHKDRMFKLHVDEGDILESARELQAVESMDQIKYAIVERNGKITVIPKRSG
jgi:uncharacterized membrane protein YcaP (DUF421 family)